MISLRGVTLSLALVLVAAGCGKKKEGEAKPDPAAADPAAKAATDPAAAPVAAPAEPYGERDALVAEACTALGKIAEKEGGGPAAEWKAAGGLDGCKQIHTSIPDIEVLRTWSTCVVAQEASGGGIAGVNAKCPIK